MMSNARLCVHVPLVMALLLLTPHHTECLCSKPAIRQLIVVSFDGFRPEYLERGVTPYLNAIRQNGVRAEYMRNVFPTKTFPNHFSIGTGLYAGVHGVTGNKVFDTQLQRELGYGYELFHQNPDVVPIWTFVEQCGLHSGCMMWPGSDFPYGKNISCTYTTNYKHKMEYSTKVDTVIEWLTSEEMPASLVMLYFDEPDYHGHVYSPDSVEVHKMIVRTDRIAQYLTKQLTDHGLIDRVNVVYLSDHGMDIIQTANFINLTAFMTPDTFDIYGNTPVVQIVPRHGFSDQVADELREAAKQNGHFQVYTADTLPARWNVANAQRMGPLVAVADVQYAFQDMWRQLDYYAKAFNISFTPDHKYGMHGYDNVVESMHAIFMANGPAFKINHKIDPFDSVELYQLFGQLLNVRPRDMPPTNGSAKYDGLHILRPKNPFCFQDTLLVDYYLFALVTSGFVAILVLILVLTNSVYRLDFDTVLGGIPPRRRLTPAMRPLRVIKKQTGESSVTLV